MNLQFDQVPELDELLMIFDLQSQMPKFFIAKTLAPSRQLCLLLLLLQIQSKSKLEKRLSLAKAFDLENLFKGNQAVLTEKIYQVFVALFDQTIPLSRDEYLLFFEDLSDEALGLIISLDRDLMIQNFQELQWLYQQKCHLIWVNDPKIDGLLRVKGNWLDLSRISVVGTRKPDQDGKRVTQKICQVAAENQVQVVSGGASGIDEHAHISTLENGGSTMVVVGCGLSHALKQSQFDHRYQSKITWVSPFQSFLSAGKWTFLARNEWIAYLSRSKIVYVIQAGHQSGTLATAKFAFHHQKTVWVCPGPVESPLYKGSHQLIREGASILIDPLEPFFTLNLRYDDQDQDQHQDQHKQIKQTNKQVEPSSKLWLVSSSQPLLLSELSELANLSMTDACVEATFLEMDGWLISKPGGRYTRGYGK